MGVTCTQGRKQVMLVESVAVMSGEKVMEETETAQNDTHTHLHC